MSSLVDYKNKNGIIYVYQNVSTWNKITKRPNTQRTCIGKRDPITNEIIHNKNYLEGQVIATVEYTKKARLYLMVVG